MFQFLSHVDFNVSQFWLSIKQFSFHPHTQIFIPIQYSFRNLLTVLYPPLIRQQHATLPVGFSLPDKLWDDGVFSHLSLFDTFLPAACSRQYLIYTLTGAPAF